MRLLDGIDFSGLGALSSDISSGDLFGRFRTALVPGKLGNTVSDDQIRTVINYVYSNYDVQRLSSPLPESIAAPIKADITGVVQSNIPANYWTTVSSVIDQLQSDGYAVVPKGYNQNASQSSAATQPSTSSGGFWSQVANAPASVAAAISQVASGSRPAQQITTISRVRQQTPAEKKRLMLILGIGGALFAVAIVALAVSD